MTGHLNFCASFRDEGRRVHDFLRSKGISHTLLVMIKRQGMLFLNGEPVYTSALLKEGDRIDITVYEEQVSDNIAPEEGPLEILYEDDDLLAVNKPADLPVHPSRAHVYGTLAGRVMAYFQGQDFVFRAVNRLDKGTSGIVLISKNPFAANWFATRGHLVKEYAALTEGHFPEDAYIDQPIRRVEEGGMLRAVLPDGEEAITLARLLRDYGSYSAVAFRLLTGRTHQIRVHSSFLGHPLLGDPLYNPQSSVTELERQALHAVRLSLTLPYSANRITLLAPLPPDMASLWEDAPLYISSDWPDAVDFKRKEGDFSIE